MTRQLEQGREDRQKRRDHALLLLIEGGLSADLSRAGADLSGFGVKLNGGDCLVTLRAVIAGRHQICFVGGEDLGAALLKASREAKNDKLHWRADKYAE